MSGLRIFISHSAKTKAAQTLLKRLHESLKDEHQVWLDRVNLRPGEPWYHSINWCIGYCNAAIVLLSEDALTRNFVFYEVSILAFRRRTNPDFKLIPICVPGEVDDDAIKKSRLSPCGISDFQMITGNDNDSIINCLHNHLNKITQCNTPLDRPIEELCEFCIRCLTMILTFNRFDN